jgi:serine/threonine-protein kinase
MMAGTPRPDPRIGTDLGPYHIEAVVGRGGMGVVYRAADTTLDRPVALKLIAPAVTDDAAFRARFLRESKMAAAIDHPNILPIYEAGEADGTFFLAMRYVDGTDLERRLREGPLEPRAAVAVLGQVAKALDAAHARGLVHRDVKPANVLLDAAAGGAEGDHAYLTDFGLTKQSGAESGLTRAGGFVGTLEYIAPEQIEGQPTDGRADQYALAAIAVAALTGQVPFPRDSDVALINAHLHDPPPSVHLRRPELPTAVDAVIARGLAKEPADRYPDCRTFVEALRDALGVSDTHSRPLPTSSGARDRRLPLLVGGLVALGIVAAIGFALASGGGSAALSTSPPASLAVASPSAGADSSPTEDVFPNSEEAALLDPLPDVLEATCQRGRYNPLESNNGRRTPIASLECTPGVTEGASSVLIRSFGSDAAKSGYPGAVISLIGGGGVYQSGPPVPAGDCAVSKRANGRWQRAAADVGAIVCFTEAATGDAILWWTYDADAIVVKATSQRGDSDALYDYFLKTARFIAP